MLRASKDLPHHLQDLPFRQWSTGLEMLVAMLLCWYLARTRLAAAVALFLLSIAWLSVDRYWELGVLVALPGRHGLAAADLFGFVAAGASLVQIWRRAHRA